MRFKVRYTQKKKKEKKWHRRTAAEIAEYHATA
jgi:hypothetical protein